VSGERSVLQPEERRSLPKRFRTPIQDLSQKIEAWNRSRYFPTYNGTWTVDPMQDLRVGSTDLEKRQERNKPEKRENYDGELPFLGRKGGSDPALDRNPVLLGLRFEFQKTDLSEEWAVE
jgi:hypothetical protein